MTVTENHNVVSSRPSAFITGTEILLESTCEEVIISRAGEESKRGSDMKDDKEKEIRQKCTSPPETLISALKSLAECSGRSITLIEKCLVIHGDALLRSIPGIEDTAAKYKQILSLHGKNGKISDIITALGKSHYSLAGSSLEPTHFYGANRVISSINEQCEGLGIPKGMSVAVALMLSISTSEDSNVVGAASDIMPEVRRFLLYVQERSFDIDSLYRKAVARQNPLSTKIGTWRPLKGKCWDVTAP